MISHEYEPPTPTKREELEHDIREKRKEVSIYQNRMIELDDKLSWATLELNELEEDLLNLEPDPDTKGE